MTSAYQVFSIFLFPVLYSLPYQNLTFYPIPKFSQWRLYPSLSVKHKFLCTTEIVFFHHFLTQPRKWEYILFSFLIFPFSSCLECNSMGMWCWDYSNYFETMKKQIKKVKSQLPKDGTAERQKALIFDDITESWVQIWKHLFLVLLWSINFYF